MTALVSTGAVPTVGGDEDTWGTELNTEVQAQHTDLQMLNTCPTSRIMGRVTAGTGEVERMTGAEAATILPAVVGDSGSGGTKGLVPAPAAGDAAANKYLKADGTWAVPKPFAFALVDGSTGDVVQGVNIASVTVGGSGLYTLNFTTAAANANYTVHATGRRGAAVGGALMTVDATTAPSTTSFRLFTILVDAGAPTAQGNPDFFYVTVWQ